MAKSVLTEARFTNETAAREHLECIRWAGKPVCPHCGGTERNVHLNGQVHRPGLLFCGDCRTQFSVTVGTVFERSKVPLHKWLLANHLLCASKKGMSSKQLERMLGVTYKTAWFMTHRIREAMRPTDGAPFGQGGSGVEVDETFIGKSGTPPSAKGTGYRHLNKVLSLVDRKSGQARSMVIENLKASTIVPILRENIAREAHVLTDDAGQYRGLSLAFAQHNVVKHNQGEYVSLADRSVHTNT